MNEHRADQEGAGWNQEHGRYDHDDQTPAAFVRSDDEGTLSDLLAQSTVLLAAARTNAAALLRDAAATYKVDTDAIAQKVTQEFAAKDKAKKAAKLTASATAKTNRAA